MKPRESLPIPVASSSRFGLQDCTSEFCITLQTSVVLVYHQLQKLLVANTHYTQIHTHTYTYIHCDLQIYQLFEMNFTIRVRCNRFPSITNQPTVMARCIHRHLAQANQRREGKRCVLCRFGAIAQGAWNVDVHFGAGNPGRIASESAEREKSLIAGR